MDDELERQHAQTILDSGTIPSVIVKLNEMAFKDGLCDKVLNKFTIKAIKRNQNVSRIKPATVKCLNAVYMFLVNNGIYPGQPIKKEPILYAYVGENDGQQITYNK